MSRLSSDELSTIALEEARSIDEFADVVGADVLPVTEWTGEPGWQVVFRVPRILSTPAWAKAYIQAAQAINERLGRAGDDRHAFVTFAAESA